MRRAGPCKRARLALRPHAEGGNEQPIHQPKPTAPGRASFHEDFNAESDFTFVSEWLESVGSERDKHCRSDTHLYHSDRDPISRNPPRLAREMGPTKDADGTWFRKPRLLLGHRPSTASQVTAAGASGVSTLSTGVEHRIYRQSNLNFNHIHFRRADDPLPEAVSGHIDNTLRPERKSSPGLSPDDLKQAMFQLETLSAGCDEEDVKAFLNATVFPNPKSDPVYGPDTGLTSTSSAVICQHLVPADPARPLKAPQPKPDKLYGYLGDPDTAFTQSQLLAQTMLHPRNPHYPAVTSKGLRFPFFAIEFKATGGTRGDLWVASNQCAGASSTCLNAAHQLNTLLPKHPTVKRVDNLSYCIAVDNNTAQLYVSWMEDGLKYYLQRVDAFLLSRPEHFLDFRKQVRNILDWGKDARLKQIGDALDLILEENRKRASEAEKSC